MIIISVVVVTGGSIGANAMTSSVELLYINGSRLCSLPNLPEARKLHSQSIDLVCGGDRRKYWGKCHDQLCGVAIHERLQTVFPPQPPGGQKASLTKFRPHLWWRRWGVLVCRIHWGHQDQHPGNPQRGSHKLGLVQWCGAYGSPLPATGNYSIMAD